MKLIAFVVVSLLLCGYVRGDLDPVRPAGQVGQAGSGIGRTGNWNSSPATSVALNARVV